MKSSKAQGIARLLESVYAAHRLTSPHWVRDLARRAGRLAAGESESVA